MNRDPAVEQVTQALRRLRNGESHAEESLVSLVYDQLHRMAVQRLTGERADHSLQPTEIVHEVFLRLRPHFVNIQDRHHFFAAARRAMRNLLVDHARARNAQKRHPGGVGIEHLGMTAASATFYLDLNETLDELDRISSRAREVFELRFFLGLTVAEISEAIGVAVSTVEKDWRLARAVLRQRRTLAQ